MRFPDLPGGSSDLPGLGKLFLFIAAAFTMLALLLDRRC